ncbi:diaminohydroxyphosphoribosylaminopyrimidine deaminase/5-amino-6-(5-phosphoribosylamino)uracil reductase [Streptacidiphilus sp. MAP12-33]
MTRAAQVSAAERDAMDLAVQLAAERLGRTTPNPSVGCVILDRQGNRVAEGAHEAAGGPHAEVVALRRAGAAAAGGTAVVTLEPCAHTGRTGPCATALIEAGIARVVYAVADPNPVATGGHERLIAARVEVVGGVREPQARQANRFWLHATTHHRPYVTWKFGATLDGRAAAADGTSRWITGPQSRRDAHELRARHDAILVGPGTVRADDPHLGLRHGVVGRAPVRVVPTRSAKDLPAHARIWDRTASTLLALADPASAAHLPGHVQRFTVPPGAGAGVDLTAVLRELHDRDIHSVLVEGGPRIAGALLAAGLVDEVVGYLAPALLGDGPSAVADAGITTLADRIRLDVLDVRVLGQDVRITATPERTTTCG